MYTIIDFWHRYQTTAKHDGGVVEFSQDNGKTWQNVKGACNRDGSGEPGILTTNFYSTIDTLTTEERSFNGIHDSMQYSRLQFWGGYAISPYGSGGCFGYPDNFFIRFRFISDSVADTLAGWIIDSIKIEHDMYPGSVANINKPKAINIFPNPSHNGTFIFPALKDEQDYSLEVYNAMGNRIVKMSYQQSIDLSQYAKGLYFYKVSDGTEYYSGWLLKE